jgi:hypothetical protein
MIWKASEERLKINRHIESLVLEKPQVEIYEPLSTEEQEYLQNPAKWSIERGYPSFED